jgi:cell wall-associated NlpC family hydrolase
MACYWIIVLKNSGLFDNITKLILKMKHLIVIPFFFFAVNSFAQLDSTTTQTQIYQDSLDFLVNYGCQYIGAGYKYGGSGLDKFDCSGLVSYIAAKKGHKIPRSSSEIAKHGEYIEADSLRPGDLIFFQGRTSNSIGHVAIVTEVRNGDIYILHATTHQGVIEEVLQKNAYFMRRWVFNKRIF